MIEIKSIRGLFVVGGKFLEGEDEVVYVNFNIKIFLFGIFIEK